MQKVAKLFSTNRRKVIGGAAGAGIIGTLLVVASLFGPFELLHIFNNEYKHAFAAVNRWEQKEAHKVMQKVLKKALERKAKPGGNPEGTSDHPVQDEIDKTNPEAAKSTMETNGIKPEFNANGEMTSLKIGDQTFDEAQLADEKFLENNPVAADQLAKAFPEIDAGHIADYRPVMETHSGVSFKGLKGTPDEDVTKTLEDEVSNGASQDELTRAEGEAIDQTKDPAKTGNTTTDAANASAAENTHQLSGELGDAANATTKVFQETGSGTSAIQAGVDVFKSKAAFKSTFVAGLLTIFCDAKNQIVKAANLRTLKYIKLLMRHGNQLLTLTGQMKEGKMTGRDFNRVMRIFQGDSTKKPDSSGKPHPDALPFDQSASWQRATKHRVTGPDLSKAANPNRDSAKDITNQINGYINSVPGAQLGCGILTSSVGGLVQGVLGIGQIVISIPDFGASEVATLAITVGIIEAFERIALPDILKAISNIAITGTENAVDWMNNSDAGLTLARNDYGRRMGAAPTTNAQTAAIALATEQDLAAQHARRPLMARLFDSNDTDSVISRLAINVPISFTSAVTQIRELPHGMIASILPSVRAADSADVNPYNFTNYNFTDAEVGAYDVYDNEKFIRTTTVSLPTGPQTYGSFKILDILGDPTTYHDTVAGDPHDDKCSGSACNYNLLHCFVNSMDHFYNPETGGATDPDCGSYGLLLPQDTSKPDDFKQPNLVDIACHYLVDRNQWPKTPCSPVFGDTLQRFRQYMLDWHAAHNFAQLTSTSQ